MIGHACYKADSFTFERLSQMKLDLIAICSKTNDCDVSMRKKDAEKNRN